MYNILDTDLLILCEKKHILITLMDLMVVGDPIRRGDISSHGGMARGSIEQQLRARGGLDHDRLPRGPP